MYMYCLLACGEDMAACVVSGLIIDAFGELRDQLEQVKEDLEVLTPVLYSHFQLFSVYHKAIIHHANTILESIHNML